jgi:DNA-binding GntR family transcriptional regulator
MGAATHATSAYERIRTDLLEGRLAPDTRLPIRGLSERYGIGQTPVREALNRLVSDGLVECRDQRGFIVPAVSVPDLLELTQTRCWLEERALRESMAGATDAWQESLVLAHHRLARTPRVIADAAGVALWERRHREFHHALIANCGSRWLVSFCEQLTDRHQRYRRLARRTAAERDVGREHADLLEAVLTGEVETAVERLVRHYEATVAVILEDRAVFPTGGEGS